MNNIVTNNKENILISIVAPVFGVVEYIDDLIKSVTTQWSTDIELIIVNDGSTDGTKSLLESYKKRITSDNFVIANKTNGGLSDARNFGVSISRGKYIMFLDGDDLLSKNTLQLIKYCLLENNPDCLITDFSYYWDDGGTYTNCSYKYIKPRTLLKYDSDILKAVYDTRQVYIWRHIFKKEIIQQYPQPVGRNYEDINTTPLLINKCNTIYYLPIKAILYRQRDNSIMKIKSEKNILDLSSGLIAVKKELEDLYGKIPDNIAIAHSIFNLYLFTWSCGDTLSNRDLDPLKLHPLFVENFNKANIVDLKVLKKIFLKEDKKTWNKFQLFFYNPNLFAKVHKTKHKYYKLYNLLNKIRKKIYDNI
ncbi:glycosyltransferase family 2 protein [Avibacterium sp. 21-586]|uniref:glycosyltransferase family 2 protein n=1 Tax=Avibacterium sp. 21-586 TaxID=2911534 RepID=UPI0022455435|nr:glycosyltransferase family 2 protein [Avibacterium sp. 21-586]MCW9710409.1 glycosyltransferase family 2 protein [Avibacterium sp. 21-586]